MKKITSLILIIILCICVGCSSHNGNNAPLDVFSILSTSSSQFVLECSSDSVYSFQTESNESIYSDSDISCTEALTDTENFYSTTESYKSQSFVSKWDIAKTANQIIAVMADGTSAEVSMHEKDENGYWHEMISVFGYVGFDGIGIASEGSKITPKGVYSLTQAFGVAQNPGTILPYVQVDESHYWVDDSASQYYNKFVSTNDVEIDWNSAEHLIDYKYAYSYAIAIDYNLDCIPGAGSAFFLHCSTGEPTYGCVAISEKDMIYVLQNIKDNAYIVISGK